MMVEFTGYLDGTELGYMNVYELIFTLSFVILWIIMVICFVLLYRELFPRKVVKD